MVITIAGIRANAAMRRQRVATAASFNRQPARQRRFAIICESGLVRAILLVGYALEETTFNASGFWTLIGLPAAYASTWSKIVSNMCASESRST